MQLIKLPTKMGTFRKLISVVVLVLLSQCSVTTTCAAASSPSEQELSLRLPTETFCSEGGVVSASWLRWAIRFLAEWMAGKALDALFLSRSELIYRLNSAAYEAEIYAQHNALSENDRDLMRYTAPRLREIARQLADLRRSHAEIRAEVERLFSGLQNQMYALEQRVQQIEDRVTQLEGRVGVIEGIVLPNPNRFLRYDAQIGAGGLVASGLKGGNSRIGGEVDLRYNFDQFFGVVVSAAYLPIGTDTAVDKLIWESFVVGLGGVVNLIPPERILSFQLAPGIGIMYSSLIESGSYGVSASVEEAASVSVFVKVDVGVTPVRYPVEPYVSFGIFSIMNKRSPINDIVGGGLWCGTIGVRYRFDVRQFINDR